MKNTIIGLVIGIILGVLSGAALYNKNPEPIIKYIPLRGSSTDSITIVNLTEQLRRTQDSLNAYKADTAISAELFVAKYKLERIRHYNEIAAKGNNIKYLRGWINRVLNE
jgi:hypothetical protein